MFASDASGDHNGGTCTRSIGIIMALDVTCIVHLFGHDVVDVSAVLIHEFLLSMCLLYVRLGSRISPKILG